MTQTSPMNVNSCVEQSRTSEFVQSFDYHIQALNFHPSSHQQPDSPTLSRSSLCLALLTNLHTLARNLDIYSSHEGCHECLGFSYRGHIVPKI